MTEHERIESAPSTNGDSRPIPPTAEPEYPPGSPSAEPHESAYGPTLASSEDGRETRDAAAEIQQRWHEIQAGFVDDPQDAIRQAGALNDEMVTSLATALNDRKHTLEQGIADGDTQQLRIGLRRYRHMVDDILAL